MTPRSAAFGRRSLVSSPGRTLTQRNMPPWGLVHSTPSGNCSPMAAPYGREREIMMGGREEQFPDGVEWTRPQGGMFLWVSVRPGLDTRDLLPKAAERGVIYVPGHGFFPGTPKVNHMRLNFSFPGEGEIRRGIRILGSVLADEGRPRKGPLAVARG